MEVGWPSAPADHVLRPAALALLALPLAALAQPGDPVSYAVTVDGDTLRGPAHVVVAEPDPEGDSAGLGAFQTRAGRRTAAVGWRLVVDGRPLRPDSVAWVVLAGTAFAVVEDGREDAVSERVFAGPIDLYSVPVDTPTFVTTYAAGSPVRPLVSGQDVRFEPTVGYLRVGDGPLQGLSNRNLRAAFADYPESRQILDRHRTLGWVQTGLFVGGAAAAVLGLRRVDLGADGDDAILPAGSGVLVAAGAVSLGVGSAMALYRSRLGLRAVDAYRQAEQTRRR